MPARKTLTTSGSLRSSCFTSRRSARRSHSSDDDRHPWLQFAVLDRHNYRLGEVLSVRCLWPVRLKLIVL